MTALSGALGVALVSGSAAALPAGGQVSAGQASIATGAGSVTITQSSSRAVLDWSSFNIGSGESVNFSQPSSSSITLNRIHDTQPSSINGQLTANGQVWLLNPNGILFGSGAQVNVGGLLATTADIANSDFMNGNYRFTPGGNPSASVSNAGSITVADTGLAALVAPQVENSGIITARLGKVQLESGDAFTLDLYGDGLINLSVSNNVAKQLVSNSGTIQADGGSITMTAAAASSAVSSVINMSGVAQAQTIGDLMGGVTMQAANGTVAISGKVDVSGRHAGESGGTVNIAANNVQQDGTIDAGGQQNGGNVSVSFTQSYTDTPTSFILASGVSGNGGTIGILGTAGNGSTLSASGTYDVSSQFAKGGNITLFADAINLTGVTLNASGATGGGIVIGSDPVSGRDSQSVTIDSNSILTADGTQGSGGTISMQGAAIAMDGQASAQGTTQGGTITVNFDSVYTDMASTLLTAASAQGQGGEVYVESSDSGTLTASGSYITDGGTTGGNIDMLTQEGNILLMGAYLSGRGPLGGGTIRIGGDFEGAEGTERSKYTYVGPNTLILTDATNDGDGGKVAVWSDEETDFYGTISAQGGPNGGNGGYVETSSHNLLVPDGMVYANAPEGQGGQWLLDPADLTITTSTGAQVTSSGTNPITWQTTSGATSGSDSYLSAATVAGELSSGTNVIIETSANGTGGNGDIFVNSSITSTGAGNLTLSAYRNIVFASSVGITTQGGSVTLTADNASNDSGAIVMNSGSSITTNGGAITMNGGTGYAYGNSAYAIGISLSGATLNAGGGNISLAGTGYAGTSGNYGVDIALASTVETSGTGTITLNGVATGSYSNPGVVIGNSGTTVSAVNGNISITGTGSGTSGVSYGVDLYNNPSVYTTGSGNITLTGTGASGGAGIYSYAASGTNTIGGASDTGTVTLSSNTDIALSSTNITTNGTAVTLDADTAAGGGAISLVSSNITTSGGSITMGGGTGTITGGTNGVNGSGFAVGDSTYNNGVTIDSNSTINAGGGNIITNGQGISTTTNNAVGGVSNNGTIETSANGSISITGIGPGGSGNDTDGIFQYGTIQSVNGNIILNGTGGPNSGSGRYGIRDYGTSQATGSGNIYATATAGYSSTPAIGFYYLTGFKTNSGSIFITTPLGAIDGYYPAAQSTSGNITFETNAFSGSFTSTIQTVGTVTFEPYTASTTVGVAGGAGTLQVTSAILGNVTAGSIAIGSTADTNTLTADAYTWSSNAAFITGTGSIVLSGIQALGTHNLTLESDTLPTVSATPTGTGTLWIEPATVSMGVLGGAGSLSVSSAYLTSLGTGWTGYIFGNPTDANLLTVGGNTWSVGSVSFLSGSGGITLAGQQVMPANGNITLQTDGTLTFSPAGNTITTTGSGVVTIETASPGTSIGFSGGAGTLQITQAMMNQISSPTVTIGALTGTGLLTTGVFTWESTLTTLNLEEGGAAGTVTIGEAMTQSSVSNANLNVYSGSNIIDNAAITAGGSDALNVLFDANHANTGSGYIYVGGNITTGGGNITLGGGSGAITAGSGYAIGNSGQAYGINIYNAAVSAGGGNVVINGEGYNTTAGGNHGFFINGSSASLTTTGNGTITINGIGGGNTNSGNDVGVEINSTVSTVNGNLTITGTGGGAGTNGSNYGVYVTGTGSTIETTGTGNISVTATGGDAGGSGSNNYGIFVSSANGIQATSTGNITLNGTGSNASGGSNFGVYVDTGHSITANGGAISITGTGGNDSGSSGGDAGIYIGGTVESAGGITLIGYGGDSGGTGTSNFGDYIAGTVTSQNGTIVIDGNTGTTTGQTVSTATGNQNIGIVNNGTISSTGNAAITLNGVGGGSGAGSANFGVSTGAASLITSATGNIAITGAGGNTPGGSDDGLALNGTVKSTGAATILITGTGGGTGAANSSSGLQVGGTVESTGTGGGTLTLIGYGGDNGGTGSSNFGFTFDGGTVTSKDGNIVIDGNTGTTTGQVVTTASGGSNYGVNLEAGGTISSTGNAAITLNGLGGGGSANYGINTVSGTNTIGGASDSQNITLNANILNFTSGTGFIQTTGTVTFAPLTAGTSIGFSGGAGTLQVTQAIMDAVNAPTVIVGSTSAGLLTTAAFNWEHTLDNLTLIGNSAVIGGNVTKGVDDGSVANNANGALTVQSNTDITTSGALSISSSGSYGELNVLFDADYAGAGGAIVLGNGSTNAVVLASNGGNITLGGGSGAITAGSGYAVGDAANTNGIYLDSNGHGTINAGGGNVIMNGQAYGSSATNDVGIYAIYNNTIETSGSGTISLYGTGGAGTTMSEGIYLSQDSVSVTNGNLTLSGTGGGGTGNTGVSLNALLGMKSSGSGNIAITGVSTSGTGITDSGGGGGVGIASTGTGSITLTGTSTGNDGVYLLGLNTTGNGNISTVSGNITITGNSSSSDGVWLLNSPNGVVSSGSANIAITGSSVSNTDSLVLQDSSVSATGSGSITLTAPTQRLSIYGSTTEVTGGATDTGNITLIANTLHDANATATFQTTGTVTFEPYTANTTIGVAGGTGTLQPLLGATTAGSIVIGNSADTGAMTIDAYSSWNAPVSFITGSSGSITVAGAQSGTGSAAFSFTGPTTLDGNLTTAGGNIAFNSAVTLGGNSTLNAGTGTLTFGSTVNGNDNLTATAGSIVLDGALGGSTALGAVSLTSASGLTLPSITASSITAQTTGASSDLALASGSALSASGSNTAITVVSGRNFINDAGSGALSTPSGRWLIYSTDPADDTFDGITGSFNRYSCTYGGSCPSFPATGDGLLYSYTPMLTVTPTGGIGLTYGAAVPNLTGYSYTLSGYLGSDGSSDSVTGSLTGSTTYAQGSSVGSYNISYGSGSLASTLGYGFTYATNAAGITVNPAAITITANNQNRTYGFGSLGTTGFTESGSLFGGQSVTGVILTTNDTSSGSGNYNVGSGFTITPGNATGSGGFLASNYSITYDTGLLTISPATLTANLTGTVDKLYDGNTSATFAPGNYRLSGVVSGDSVSLNDPASGSYDTASAGTGKMVYVSGLALSGPAASDYVLASASISGAVGEISSVPLLSIPSAVRIAPTATISQVSGGPADGGWDSWYAPPGQCKIINGKQVCDPMCDPTEAFVTTSPED